MDDLEREMEDLRNQMRRILSGADGSGRRTALDRLRSSLGLPGLSAARNTGASGKDAPESPEPRPGTPTPPDAGGGAQEPSEPSEGRSWWRRMFGG